MLKGEGKQERANTLGLKLLRGLKGKAWRAVRPLAKGADRAKLAQDEPDRRNDASFLSWWRESRSQDLRPRSVSMQPRAEELPDARTRLEAIRQRVRAKELAPKQP